MGAPDPLEPFHRGGADALVAFDFDGTLAPIVDVPAAAAPLDGAVAALERLSVRVGEVAVVSGRPIEFLQRWFPEPSAVTLVGLYGLQRRRFGERTDHPGAAQWSRVVAEVAERARRDGPGGMDVESKGLSLTLHYRRRPELQGDVVEWAGRAAASSGLELRAAKMSVELHPPVDVDKGTALRSLVAAHVGPVLFAGDDLGDVPAFDVLDGLRSEGRAVLAVAVDGAEAPAALVERADLVLAGPAAVADLVRALSA